jgi:putative endonuclease
MTNQSTGQSGELSAAAYLRGKGYEILAANWRSGHKEIDIIARDKSTVVFVEVKTRRSSLYGYPEESVTLSKQQKIAAAAEEWIYQNEWKNEIRFDVIAILKEKNKTVMTHFVDAFAP